MIAGAVGTTFVVFVAVILVAGVLIGLATGRRR